MGSKEMTKAGSFILFRQGSNKFVKNWQDKETSGRVLIDDDTKQNSAF